MMLFGSPKERWNPHAFSNLSDSYYSDSALRQLEEAPAPAAPGTWIPEALPIFDIKTNPVENLDTRLPMPVLASPAYETMGENINGMLPQEESLCCIQDIPSKELRQVRENLGATMADRGRWGRGPGAGVAASLTHAPESGTQQIQHGPVSVSGPEYNDELYDQGFISMGAVPVVYAGKYKDPITGVEYDGYESAMPPPDADYEEMLQAPARNIKLAQLQGGWTDNTPRPTKREVLEDDYHMQYDRTINTFGTYDPSRLEERFERNNRFSRDNEHPDPEGSILDHTPANFDGNQNVKIRPMPYLPPTNRGKWAETTFRDGIDPSVAVGNSESTVPQTFTTFPQERMENTRQDGGGMEPTQQYEGFTLLQMGAGSHDIMPTQRSANEHRMPNMGPSQTAVPQQKNMDQQVAPATGFTGLSVLFDQQRAAHGATTNSHLIHPEEVAAPNSLNGIQPYHFEQHTAVNTMHDGSGGNTAQSIRMRTEEVLPANKRSGMQAVNIAGDFGGIQDQNGQAQKLEYQEVSAHTSKGGLAVQDEQFGSHGGEAHAPLLKAQMYNMRGKNKLEMLKGLYSAFNPGQSGQEAQPNLGTITNNLAKKGAEYDLRIPSASLYGSENSGFGMQNWTQVTEMNGKKEVQYDPVAIDVGPKDNSLFLGYYPQKVDDTKLNSREFGNFVHAVGTAPMANFMSQREPCGL